MTIEDIFLGFSFFNADNVFLILGFLLIVFLIALTIYYIIY